MSATTKRESKNERVLWIVIAVCAVLGTVVAVGAVSLAAWDYFAANSAVAGAWQERGQRGDFWGGHLAAGAGSVSVLLLIIAGLLQILEHSHARQGGEQTRLTAGTELLLEQLHLTKSHPEMWRYFYGDAKGKAVPLAEVRDEDRPLLKALSETVLTHLAVQMLMMARNEPYPRSGVLVVLLCRFQSSLVLGDSLEDTLHEFPVTGAALLVAKEGGVHQARDRMKALRDAPSTGRVAEIRPIVLKYQANILASHNDFWDIVNAAYESPHREELENALRELIAKGLYSGENVR